MNHWTNFHSHSHYCDGKGALSEHVAAAIALNMPVFGFSSHAPLPFDCLWSMPAEQLERYLNESRGLKQEFSGQIQLYTGLEVDYIPSLAGPSRLPVNKSAFDYLIGSIHFVDFFPDGTSWEIDGQHKVFLHGLQQIFGGDIKTALQRYFALTRQMVTDDCPDVVGHLDKINIQDAQGALFDTSADWYRKEVLHTLEEIKSSGAIVEVNTRGLYKKKYHTTYPITWTLQQLRKMEIPVMLNADSHTPRELTGAFPETARLLNELGFEELSILWEGEWQSFPFSEKGLLLPG